MELRKLSPERIDQHLMYLATLCPSRKRVKAAGLARRIRYTLALRDGTACAICGQDIDMSLDGTEDDMAPTLEHTLALADGGTNVPGNWALAHRFCNREKSSHADRAYGELHRKPVQETG